MSDNSYGMSINVGMVNKDGKVDTGVKYSDSNGFKFDRNYKDLDEDKAFDLVSKDVLGEYAKFAKELAAKRKAEQHTFTTSTPVNANDRIRDLEEANRRLVEQNKRLQDRLAERDQAPKIDVATETAPKKEEKKVETKHPKPVKTSSTYGRKRHERESDVYRDMMKMLNGVFDGKAPRLGAFSDFDDFFTW